MPNKFFVPGEERGQRVNDLFGSIAPRYDLLNNIQSLGLHVFWKSRLVRMTRPLEGERVLDICCGTGDLTLRFAQAKTDAIGLDFSEAMLQIARNRAECRKLAAMFIQGNAHELGFPDASFDIVSVGYGLRNLANIDKALAEIRRVLRTRGRLAIIEFGKPGNAIWRALYFWHLKHVTPFLGKLLCGDAEAYSYIWESLKHYPGAEEISARIRAHGFTNVTLHRLIGGAMSIHLATL